MSRLHPWLVLATLVGCHHASSIPLHARVDGGAGSGSVVTEQVAEILRAPDTAVVGRIRKGDEMDPNPLPLDAPTLQALADALVALPPKNRGITKMCSFSPWVEFELQRGSNTLSLSICFQCNQVLVEEGPSPKRSSMVDFDAQRASLLAVTKQALAADAPTQALK